MDGWMGGWMESRYVVGSCLSSKKPMEEPRFGDVEEERSV